MSERFRFYKHRRAKRVFTVKWGASPALSSATWASSPDGLTIAATSINAGDALARLEGGTEGTRYTVECDATFADGQTDVETFDVVVT
jgi:hypothetical protein